MHAHDITLALQNRLARDGIQPDPELAADIARRFADLATRWPGTFQMRPDQLAFAYLGAESGCAALEGRAQAFALEMGCGEGKQEGLAVAMAATLGRAARLGRDDARVLFITSTPELVRQMAASPALAGGEIPLHLHDEIPTPAAGRKAGLHLMDVNTLLACMLDIRAGGRHSLLDEADKVFADEAQVFLQHNPVIRSRGRDILSRLRRHEPIQAERAQAELALLETLYASVTAAMAENPQRVRHCGNRHARRFAFDEGYPRARLHRTLSEQAPEAMHTLSLCDEASLQPLCDQIATLSILHAGRDYYLRRDADGAVCGYCVADGSNGAPMADTHFSDRLLATFLALRHIRPAARRSETESRFLADIWLSRTLAEAAPHHVLAHIGAPRFLFASATLSPVRRTLEAHGVAAIALQAETTLSPTDPAVSLGVADAASEGEFLDQLAAMLPALPEQIALTSRDARALAVLADALDALAGTSHPLAGHAVVRLFHHAENPDAGALRERAETLKAEIRQNPGLGRILLIQGLGEGSNLFGVSPQGEYRAAIVTLDLAPLDRLTHTRYRVGARGRAPGTFAQRLPRTTLDAQPLTEAEHGELDAAEPKRQHAVLLEIQGRMLEEAGEHLAVHRVLREAATHRVASKVGVKYFGERAKQNNGEEIENPSRRSFLTTAGKTALGVGAARDWGQVFPVAYCPRHNARAMSAMVPARLPGGVAPNPSLREGFAALQRCGGLERSRCCGRERSGAPSIPCATYRFLR